MRENLKTQHNLQANDETKTVKNERTTKISMIQTTKINYNNNRKNVLHWQWLILSSNKGIIILNIDVYAESNQLIKFIGIVLQNE